MPSFFQSLWSRPDPVLAEAAIAGEILVAKVRLALATLLLLILLINSLFFFPVKPKEGLVGITLATGTFLLSVSMYVLITRNYNPHWLPFVSSALTSRSLAPL